MTAAVLVSQIPGVPSWSLFSQLARASTMHHMEEPPHSEGQLQFSAEVAEFLHACCELCCQMWSCRAGPGKNHKMFCAAACGLGVCQKCLT